jgi:hypothetical protein
MENEFSTDFARDLFLLNNSLEEIEHITGIPYQQLSLLALDGNWQQLKEELDLTPLLRDLGQRPDYFKAFQVLAEFYLYLLEKDEQLACRVWPSIWQFLEQIRCSDPRLNLPPQLMN